MKPDPGFFAVIFAAILSLNVSPAFAQPSESVEELVKTADEFRAKADPANAAAFYEKAAIEFVRIGSTEKAIESYNQIGAILNRQDKYEQARSYLEKALALGRAANLTESLAVATTYINLGVTNGAENKFDESLNYHNKALSIRLAKLGANSADVATSYGNIGNIYFRMKKYDRAINAHSKAKSIRERIFGKNGAEVEQSYRNLGNAYKEKKEYKKSLGYFEKALTVKIALLGPNHKDLVRYYKSISELYALTGDKARADAALSKGEVIEKQAKQ